MKFNFSSLISRTILILGMAALLAKADDWPQWRGPNRDGISQEKGWVSDWPKEGPKQLWQARVGVGYSSESVVKGRLYTMGNVEGNDVITCLDANTGREIWHYSYPCSPKDPNGYPGTRCTPTVDGTMVYAVSRKGHLHCLNTSDGKMVWSRNFEKDFNAKEPTWGFAGSPLVHGNLLIAETGGTGTAVVAFNKANGQVVWKSGDDGAGYGSPVAFSFKGDPAVAVFGATTVAAYGIKDGKQLWQYPWKTSYEVNAATPIIQGTRVFISSGYGSGCALVDFSNGNVKEVWRNKNMRNHVNSCVLFKERFYGFDESTLKCLDFETGKVLWSEGKFGKGSLIVADEKLLIFSDKGVLALAEAAGDGFHEIASAQVIGGNSTWVIPVLANGKIYCRSLEKLIALDVSEKSVAFARKPGHAAPGR